MGWTTVWNLGEMFASVAYDKRIYSNLRRPVILSRGPESVSLHASLGGRGFLGCDTPADLWFDLAHLQKKDAQGRGGDA